MNRTVLWIGIALMQIRTRISMFMLIPTRIRTRLAPKQCNPYEDPTKVLQYTCWKIRIFFFYFLSQQCHFTKYYLSHQCQMCISSVFWMAYWNFLERSLLCQHLHLLRIDTNPDLDPAKWCEPDPVQIRNTGIETNCKGKKHFQLANKGRNEPHLTSMQWTVPASVEARQWKGLNWSQITRSTSPPTRQALWLSWLRQSAARTRWSQQPVARVCGSEGCQARLCTFSLWYLHTYKKIMMQAFAWMRLRKKAFSWIKNCRNRSSVRLISEVQGKRLYSIS